MIRVAIAEDNYFSLKAIEDKLTNYQDISIIYSAKNGIQLIEMLQQNSAIDLILMDIEMPLMDGINTTEKVKELYPNIKIVILTIYDDDDYIFNAIKAGADSYILKETTSKKIYETISDTINGGSVMSPSIAIKTLQLLKKASFIKQDKNSVNICLSDRETEILDHLSKGLSNKMIGEQLFISPFTVKRHIENIYRKLQAQNRIELIEKARRTGLI